MFCFTRKCSHPFILLSLFLTACGGGSDDPPPRGSLAIAEADADHDGLIEIATLEQLDWIRNDPAGKSLTDFGRQVNSNGCPASGCFGYELVADLDFDTNGDGVLNASDTYFDYNKNGSNAGWEPLPRFTGSFEGNGHHIRNLFINRPDWTLSVGLFDSLASVEGAETAVQNLILDGELSSITGYYDVGALAGGLRVGGKTTITNVHVSGKNIGKGDVGGVIGYVVSSGTLIADSNSAVGVIDAGDGTAGGLFGFALLENGDAYTVANLAKNSASVIVSGGSAGGLIGSLAAADSTVIEQNWSSGAITGQNSAGGLVANTFGKSVRIHDSYSTASVFAGGATAGGVIGSLTVTVASISNVHASGSVTGNANVGGLIGELACSDATFIEESRASGDVTGLFEDLSTDISYSLSGGSAGGLIGAIHTPATGRCGVRRSYASGEVRGGYASGGLVGRLDSPNYSGLDADAPTGTIELSDSISAGVVHAAWRAGGLVGDVDLSYGSSFIAKQNLILGQISADPAPTTVSGSGALTGVTVLNTWSGANAQSSADLSFNYWAWDATTTSTGVGVTSLSVTQTGNLSVTRAELECTVAANDSMCTGYELFHGWDATINAQGRPAWHFGDTAQLPGLVIGNEVHRPVIGADGFLVVVESL